MKRCGNCGTEKDEGEFSKNRRAKDGLQYQCKACQQQYRKANAEAIKQKHAEYYKANTEAIKQKCTEYYKANAEALRRRNAEYYKANIETIKQYNAEYTQQRQQTDVSYKLCGLLRSRLHQALKGNFKRGSAVKDLGCSIEQLKHHLESQFEDGMTWDNYGRGKGMWNIDHWIALHMLDLTNFIDFQIANYWQNLRPMWHKDNMARDYSEVEEMIPIAREYFLAIDG